MFTITKVNEVDIWTCLKLTHDTHQVEQKPDEFVLYYQQY